MIRFGLLGVGFIGAVHARNIVENGRAELTALYDPDSAKARDAAERHGACACASAEDVLAQSVDAVLIASATDAHAGQLAMAARAGKAVLCEKPINNTTAAAFDAVAAALRAGVPAAMGFNRRYAREHALLKQAVASGRLGAVRLAQFVARAAQTPTPQYVRISGGIFHVSMTHFFDLACWLLDDKPEQATAFATATANPAFSAAGEADTAMALMRMPGGALVHINNCYGSAYGYDERIEVMGADAIGESNAKPLDDFQVRDAAGRHASRLMDDWFDRMEHTYLDELDAFIDALEGEPMSNATLLDGLRAQLLADAAQRSLVEGRAVTLDWTALEALA